MNLPTINQLADASMISAAAGGRVAAKAMTLPHAPRNFEEQTLSKLEHDMPEDGHTPIFAAMPDHPRISLSLNTRGDRPVAHGFDKVFYSGALGCLAQSRPMPAVAVTP